MPIIPPIQPVPVGPFNVTLIGSDLADTLNGSTLADLIYGGAGNDIINALGGSDYIDGGDGHDQIFGSGGNDTLIGGAGDDRLYGGDGRDMLFGGLGHDLLQSGSGDSTLMGGAGNDILNARLSDGGNKLLFGGEGSDQFNLQLVGNVPLSETVIGDFDITRDSFTVDGMDGRAVIGAGAYISTLAGRLFLTLASGDVVGFEGLTAEQIYVHYGLGGNDTLVGDQGNDRFLSGAGHDLLDGADGNDLLSGGTGNDTILGGRGHDSIGGNDGADLLIGGEGNDTIYGHAHFDTIFGDQGNDMLYGGAQTALLYGGEGNDGLQTRMLDGGDSTLTGGSGIDAFDFWTPRAGKGAHAVIADFEAGEAVTITIGNTVTGLAQYMQQNGLDFSGVEGQARVDLVDGAGSITFNGWSAEGLRVAFGWGDPIH
ncbi:calcium-binding protein [Gemmobacter serpentinus]|uniref:calcium-binding protein n=1 Tax=Gemmobacter serpentinus TaxID=2652247 RepID=UPI00124C8BCD|nr:calcium-binding protein [Gemmobacter serpentinus]